MDIIPYFYAHDVTYRDIYVTGSSDIQRETLERRRVVVFGLCGRRRQCGCRFHFCVRTIDYWLYQFRLVSVCHLNTHPAPRLDADTLVPGCTFHGFKRKLRRKKNAWIDSIRAKPSESRTWASASAVNGNVGLNLWVSSIFYFQPLF